MTPGERLYPPAREETRVAYCARCLARFTQYRYLARVVEGEGWTEALVWRPRNCQKCERRAMWSEHK